jgi:hypothetical protein
VQTRGFLGLTFDHMDIETCNLPGSRAAEEGQEDDGDRQADLCQQTGASEDMSRGLFNQRWSNETDLDDQLPH